MNDCSVDSALTIGTGRAHGHHGEIVQGVFSTPEGVMCRGLVTMPCGLFRSTAMFRPSRSAHLTSRTPNKSKSLAAARLFLDEFGLREMGGALTIESDIPLGWGLGSSTADVTATIRALCSAFGVTISAGQTARMAARAEIACDPIMFEDSSMIFAHRDGRVIELLPGPLPPIEVLGFNSDGDGVDTLALPPANYSDAELWAFRPIIDDLRRAVIDRDARLLGRAATASARINERFLPKRNFDALTRIAEDAGAVGIQVAHSGTIVGILFDPIDEASLDAAVDHAQQRLSEIGIEDSWRFRAGRSDR